MLGLVFWGAASICIVALFFTLAYNSARIQDDGSIVAMPEWALMIGASIVASAIGISFAMVKFDLSMDKIFSSWTVILGATIVASSLAIFYVAAGAQETKVCKLKQQLADERATSIAKQIDVNEEFVKELLEEDLSDIEVEDLVPQPEPSITDEKIQTFRTWSGAELSRL